MTAPNPTNELLERLAIEAEPTCRAKAVELREAAEDEHQRQVAGFYFNCRRFGDFLQIEVRRDANPATLTKAWFRPESEREFATCINLKLVETIQMLAGRRPDNEGALGFHFRTRGDGENSAYGTLGGTGFGHHPAETGCRYVVVPEYEYGEFTAPESRVVWRVKSKPESMSDGGHVHQMSDGSYKIKHRVLGFPRPAVDDRVVFEGIRATLYVPAGLGVDVLTQILSASERAL